MLTRTELLAIAAAGGAQWGVVLILTSQGDTMGAHSIARASNPADVRYAQYVGRIGALAVALGIGAAISTGHGIGLGVAYADDSNASQENGDTGDNGDNSGSGGTSGTLTSPATETEKADDSGHPRSPLGRLANIPKMIFNATGGAQTSSVTKPRPQLPKLRTVLDDIATGIKHDAPDSTDEPQGSAPQFNSNERSHAYVPPGKQSVDNDPPAITSIPTKVADQFRTTIAPPMARLHVVKTPPAQVFGAKNADITDVRSFVGQRHVTQDVDTEDQSPMGPLGVLPGNHMSVVNAVLAVAVAPFLTPNPAAPQDPPLLLGVLAWARREIQRTFCNTTPRAVDDNVSTNEDVEVTGNVLTNDLDPDLHDVKTVASYTQPTHGEVVLDDDGTFIYTPEENYNGPDSFTYTVTDETSPWHVHGVAGFVFGGSHTSTQTATVNINVKPIDDPTVFGEHKLKVDEDSTDTSIDVLATDKDKDGTLRLTGTPTAEHGTVGITDGKLTYKPNADYHGDDTITYEVTDPDGNKATGTVAVTVVQTGVVSPVNFDVSATVPVSGSPFGVAVQPDGNRVYTTDRNGSVTVIDVDPDSPTYNQAVGAPITVGADPLSVAFTSTHAYVSNASGESLSVIDLDSGEVVATIPLEGRPSELAITPDGKRAYVSNQDTDSVVMIDVDPNSPTFNQVVGSPIPVGDLPRYVAITPDGKHAYVVNEFENTVSVIDIDQNSETFNQVVGAPIAVGQGPIGLAINHAGTRAYVTNYGEQSVSVIDIDPDSATYNQVISAPIKVGSSPLGVVVSPDDSRVYTANQHSNSISVINADSNAVIATVPVGSVPTGIAVSSDGSQIYVANQFSSDLTVITASTSVV